MNNNEIVRLNDKELREALIGWLNRRVKKPLKIIEELNVNYGTTIADVVAIYKDAHCYEIKGDGDKVERIIEQGISYNLAFKRITLITTSKHRNKAMRLAPSFWGVIIAKYQNGNVKFKYERKATNNPNFDGVVALHTLWKSEMLDILLKENIQLASRDKNRDAITKAISEKLSDKNISLEISQKLLSRTII